MRVLTRGKLGIEKGAVRKGGLFSIFIFFFYRNNLFGEEADESIHHLSSKVAADK